MMSDEFKFITGYQNITEIDEYGNKSVIMVLQRYTRKLQSLFHGTEK
jgi:hypothetical protein